MWQRGEQWWGTGHSTGSLRAEGTVVAKSRIHWKTIVEISWDAALIFTDDQTTPDKNTSNMSLEDRKLLLTYSRISVEENYFKLISIGSQNVIFILLRFNLAYLLQQRGEIPVFIFFISLGHHGGEVNECLHDSLILVILGTNKHQCHLQQIK